MADAVTTQVIHDGPHNYVVRLKNVSDGTGESAVTKIDVSTLSNVSQYLACGSVSITKIFYRNQGMSVRLLWDGTTDAVAALLPADSQGEINIEDTGGIINSVEAGKTGDLKLTTVGATSGDTYDITIFCRKKPVIPTSFPESDLLAWLGAPASGAWSDKFMGAEADTLLAALQADGTAIYLSLADRARVQINGSGGAPSVGNGVGFLANNGASGTAGRSIEAALGVERLANGAGGFSSAEGWVAGFGIVNGTLTVASNALVLTRGAGDTGSGRYVLPVATAVGTSYQILVGALTTTGSFPSVSVSNLSNGTGAFSSYFVNGSYLFTATATTTYVVLAFSSTAAGQTVTLSSLSLRPLSGSGHLVAPSTAGSAILQAGYLDFDNSDDEYATTAPPADGWDVVMGVKSAGSAFIALNENDTTGSYVAKAESGSTSSPNNDSGSPTTLVDGTVISPDQGGALFTALGTSARVLEIQDVDFTDWSALQINGYPLFRGIDRLYGVIISPSDVTARPLLRRAMAALAGVTLS